MNPKREILTSALLIPLLLAGCASDLPLRHEVGFDVPEDYGRRSATGLKPDGTWWQEFGSPGLNEAVERALADNPTLDAARSRLAQAEALARGASAPLRPTLDLAGSAGWTRRAAGAGFGGDTVRESEQYALSAAAAYEVDLWRRLSSSARAAAFDYAAVRFDVQAATMSLSAQTVETWFAITEQLALLDLLHDQLEVSRKFLKLTELRFRRGLASALDVLQQRQQTGVIEVLVPQTESDLGVLQHQLAVLLGVPARTNGVPQPPSVFPALPPLPDVGVPMDLLLERPDVRAAYERLQSADQRLAAASADRLPSVRLTAGIGYADEDASALFDDWVGEALAVIRLPLVDGGRRRAEVDRAYGAAEERVASYRDAMLTGIREVEDALYREQKQSEYLQGLEAQLGHARRTLQQSRRRYVGGLTDYLPVLTALNQVQITERTVVRARRRLISFRVQLCRALGGGWAAAYESRGEVSRIRKGE